MIDAEYKETHLAIIEFIEGSFVVHMIKGEFEGEILGADSWLEDEKEVIRKYF